ncbi:hypothetical protein MJO29_003339 [Puccinia striiformis f. sp. tritici]|nr:hypothetical protein MJO29_003339 [Puccinia striiformis f. sp. tritici]
MSAGGAGRVSSCCSVDAGGTHFLAIGGGAGEGHILRGDDILLGGVAMFLGGEGKLINGERGLNGAEDTLGGDGNLGRGGDT